MTLDLTTFTEVDPSSHLSRTSTTETVAAMASNENCYAYYDYGAAYFSGSAYFEGEISITAGTGTGSRNLISGFSAQLGAYFDAADSASLIFQYGTSPTPYADLRTASVQTDGAGAVLALNTTYYYRVGFFSSLGQFGSQIIQFFSDSGRTTLVSSAVNPRTANTTFRYFYSQMGLHSAGTGTITGTNANITLFAPTDGNLVLTTCTEVDPNAHLVEVANSVKATTLNTNETAYVYKDYGTGFVANSYTFKGAMYVSAFVTGAAGQMFNIMSLVNTLGHANQTNDLQGIAVNWVSATTFSLKVREVTGAIEYLSSASSTLTTNTPYWITINRDAAVGTYGTLYVKIYLDPTYTTQLGSTVSLTLHDNGTPDLAAFRYFNVLQSYNTGTSRTSSFVVGGIDATIVQVVTGTVAITGANTAVAVTGSVATLGTIAISGANTVVAATCNQLIPMGTIAITGANTVVSVAASLKNKAEIVFGSANTVVHVAAGTKTTGTIAITGANTVVAATGTSSTSTDVFSATIRHKTTGAAITGLTSVYLKINRPSDNKRWDFSTNTFVDTPGSASITLLEVNSTGLPGLYRNTVTTTSWEGWIEFEATYDDGSYMYAYAGEAYYLSGVRASGVWSANESAAIAAIPTAAENAAAVSLLTLDANIVKVNGTDVVGSGTPAAPWGP